MKMLDDMLGLRYVERTCFFPARIRPGFALMARRDFAGRSVLKFFGFRSLQHCLSLIHHIENDPHWSLRASMARWQQPGKPRSLPR